MKIYLIRHGIAEERHLFAQKNPDDRLRPLTERGVDRLHRAALFLQKHESNIDLFLQSPLERCQQTVEVLHAYYENAVVKTTPHLLPGHSAAALFEELSTHFEHDSIALVGHEPDLGQFLSWLLFRQASEHFPLKKGGIAKLDLFSDDSCSLKWLLRPKFF